MDRLMAFTIIIILILSVFAGAIADGLTEKGSTNWGHNVELFEKPLLLIAGVLAGTWTVILAYVGFRIAFFDYTKNLAKGDSFFYHGTVGWWDNMLRKNPSIPGEVFGRLVFLAFGIAFTILEIV